MAIGGIIPLPLSAVSAIEYSTLTGQPFLGVLSAALLLSFAFGLLAGAALGQFLKRLHFYQFDGMVVIIPKSALRAQVSTGPGPADRSECEP